MEGDQQRILVITEHDEWGRVASPGAKAEKFELAQRKADYLLEREDGTRKVTEIRVYKSN